MRTKSCLTIYSAENTHPLCNVTSDIDHSVNKRLLHFFFSQLNLRQHYHQGVFRKYHRWKLLQPDWNVCLHAQQIINAQYDCSIIRWELGGTCCFYWTWINVKIKSKFHSFAFKTFHFAEFSDDACLRKHFNESKCTLSSMLNHPADIRKLLDAAYQK